MVAREQLPAANAQDRDTRVVTVARVPDNVSIATFHLEHDRRLFHPLEMPQCITQLRRALEVEARRRDLHSIAHAADHLVGATIEKQQHLVDHLTIVVLRLCQDARRLTSPDVIVQARALWHLTRHVVVARPHGEDALHDVQRTTHLPDVGVRPEVFRAVVNETPRHEDPRERLLYRDLDVRVRLVVAERDVEARPVLLDQVRLQNQRVRLGGNDDGVEVGSLAHERPRFHALEMVAAQIASYARAQPFRFPDVQHHAIRILPQVHARRLRKVRQFRSNGVGGDQHEAKTRLGSHDRGGRLARGVAREPEIASATRRLIADASSTPAINVLAK